MQPVIAHELCRACPNVLLETSNQEAPELAVTVDAVGAGRIVFGSDRPRRNLNDALVACDQARLDAREKQLVLVVNAERLLVGSWTG
jgi:predicted TIM-barrel fold metal-dependent hydrolase